MTKKIIASAEQVEGQAYKVSKYSLRVEVKNVGRWVCWKELGEGQNK
jgi:hypothetical protein